MKIAVKAVLFLLLTATMARTEVFKTPLNKLSGDWTVNLRCIIGEHGVSIPIPERWRVTKASVTFSYVNSSNLIEEISSLTVKLNDLPLAQTRLNPLNPEGRMTVALPPSQLKAGYNEVKFMAIQHFTRDCENPCSPDLWTTLNFEDSELVIEYELNPVPLKLSSMANFLFDPRIMPQGEVNVVTGKHTSDILTLAGIVASGVTRRFDYRKASLTTSGDIKPGVDNIFVGDEKALNVFLSRKGISPVKMEGPFMGIIPLPLSDEALAGVARKGSTAPSGHGRVISRVTEGPNLGWLSMTAGKEDPLYIAAMAVPGAIHTGVNVFFPPSSVLEVEDFANQFGLSLSSGSLNTLADRRAKFPGERSRYGAPSPDTAPLGISGAEYSDPTHALVIVSGKTFDHIKISSETLASMTFPFPGTASTTIKQFELPDIMLYSGKHMLVSDKIIRFKTLDFPTHTFRGLQGNPRDITFRLPPDFFIKENQYAKLVLNFAYGAGLRPDSVLNILLNGVHVRAINMDKATGDTIEGYKVEIPTYLFKPGSNTIRLAPILTPMAKECDLIQPESLFLTIFENSTIYFPPMAHFVSLPNLELFMLNGFPFTRWPDGFESLIYITKDDPALINAAMNVIGMVTQRNGYPLLGMKISLEKPDKWEGELITIGSVNTIPDEFKKGTPLTLMQETQVRYPVVDNLGGETSYAFSKQIAGLGPDSALLMESQSPFKSGRAMLTMTAMTPEDVLKLSRALFEPEAQTQINGDTAVVEFGETNLKIATQSATEHFFVGKFGKITFLDYFFHTYHYAYYFLLGGILLISTLILYFFFKRHGARRILAGEGGEGEGKPGIKNLFARLFLKKSKRGEDEHDKGD
ncbi:MAG: cellulose biosynthesis cyclic di-GMP-binding regulatory protein BcsB [Nitrospinae bacterium]|nr:cellulose biosynthesis cyclic di-GMP-binding regulatory protein BcsB [Nitrospinota bacterium]